MAGSVVAVAPLADEPDAVAPPRLATVVGGGHDADERETRVQRRGAFLRARCTCEMRLVGETTRKLPTLDRLAATARKRVDDPDPRRRADRDREVEAELAQPSRNSRDPP